MLAGKAPQKSRFLGDPANRRGRDTNGEARGKIREVWTQTGRLAGKSARSGHKRGCSRENPRGLNTTGECSRENPRGLNTTGECSAGNRRGLDTREECSAGNRRGLNTTGECSAGNRRGLNTTGRLAGKSARSEHKRG